MIGRKTFDETCFPVGVKITPYKVVVTMVSSKRKNYLVTDNIDIKIPCVKMMRIQFHVDF